MSSKLNLEVVTVSDFLLHYEMISVYYHNSFFHLFILSIVDLQCSAVQQSDRTWEEFNF